VASGRYLHELGRRPNLPVALERKLVADAKRGDRRARAQLVEAFLPAVAGVARVYRGRGQIERAELMQEGVVGLLRALERYEPERGVPFWGFAVWWVRQAMQQLVAELARPVVLSDHALRQVARLSEVHTGHLRRHGREPTAQELASGSGIDREDVDNLLATERPARSLEAPAGGAGGDGVGSFGELFVTPSPKTSTSASWRRLPRRVTGPSERTERARAAHTQRPLRPRWTGAEPPEIAAALGLSAERVRQLERRAVGKLRAGAGVDTDGWTPIPHGRKTPSNESGTGGGAAGSDIPR
jgi:RNA polymerase primary sigma factor